MGSIFLVGTIVYFIPCSLKIGAWVPFVNWFICWCGSKKHFDIGATFLNLRRYDPVGL